ncbi:MFS transporter [Spirillospora sp. NPDC052242]
MALPRMQEDLGFSQENLSWVFNAYVVAFGGLLLLGGRLSDLFGARRLFSAGRVVLLAGSAVAGAAGTVAVELTGRALQGVGAALVRPDGSYWVDVLPASLVAALGMSLAFIPSPGTAMSAAAPEEGGLASGIVNTGYQVGSALGLAAMTAVAASFGADEPGNLPALTDGFPAAFVGAGLIALAGAGPTAVTLRMPRRSPEPAPAAPRETAKGR